jgi:site-specific DNA-methyltransferase (adenine-specific)
VPQGDFFGAAYSFEQENASIDLDLLQNSLPYKFVDPHKMNKKIDVKKLQFGSKIDKASGDREEYFTVKRIIKPQLVELNNNLIIRLIGIKEKPSANGEATSYLTKKILGQKVYLKYDDEKYEEDHNLQCYLYLKNKTFINAHLLKEGLAEVDNQAVFRQKNKFVQLEAHYG